MRNITTDFIKKIFWDNDLGRVKTAEPLKGGLVSPAYDVMLYDGTHRVMKFNSGEKSYEALFKEKWCSDQALRLGVPTIEIFALGELEDGAWCVQKKLEGVLGEDLPTKDHVRIAYELGQMGAKINTIKTHGCGFYLDTDPPHHFTTDWQNSFEWSMEWIFENDILDKAMALDRKEKKKYRKYVEPMHDWDFEPRLAHADLFARNTILDTDGHVQLIDWGSALGHYAPVAEIGFFYAYTHNHEEREAFLKGYGISMDQFDSIKEDVFRVAVIEVLGCVVWGV